MSAGILAPSVHAKNRGTILRMSTEAILRMQKSSLPGPVAEVHMTPLITQCAKWSLAHRFMTGMFGTSH